MKKFINSLTQNLFWKIMSLILAICFWFMVVNIENPLTTSTFRVQIAIQNLNKVTENDYVLLNEQQIKSSRVDIQIRASKSNLATLNELKSGIIAYIDLSPIDVSYANRVGQQLSVNIDVELPKALTASDFEIIRKSPTTTEIILDNYETRTFPISVDRTGEVSEGYISMPPICEPSEAQLSGARTVLDSIGNVAVVVDLKTASENIVTTGTPKIYSWSNEEIVDKIETDVEEVNITVPVYKYAKIPIKPSIVGSIVEGYLLEDVIIEPEYIEVVGAEKDIEQLDSIVIGPINIDNISEDKVSIFDIRNNLLNTRLSVKNGTPHEVTITVDIEQELVKDLSLPFEKINIRGLTTSVDLPAIVEFKVKGTEDAINSLDAESLSGFIDFTGLGVGEHEIEVTINLPSNLSLAEKAMTKVYISSATEEPETDQTVEPKVDEVQVSPTP